MGKAFSAAASILLLVLANWAGTHWKQATVPPNDADRAEYTTTAPEASMYANPHIQRTNLPVETAVPH
jgi:hypothetical protein